jgi:uncharacterized repeat protein (TIGR03803 family)
MAPDGSGFTVLHSFSGAPADGTEPRAGLIQGSDGTLYGTTYYGGSADRGTVFRLASDGSGFTLLHSFTAAPTDGQYPSASLIQGLDGMLYGTTVYGGSGDGTVFQIAPDGNGFTVLHSFIGGTTDGALPFAGLIQGPDDTLYGTTYSGGSPPGGTVFQMATDGSGFTLLHSFNQFREGARPLAGLIQGPDGTLYGTTTYTYRNGFPAPLGMIFRLAADGSGFTVLHSFTGDSTDGRYPLAGLIQGPDGTLYGTTSEGGTANLGTVFQMALDGSGFMLLHSFTGAPTDGQYPSASLIQRPDGALYGTTYRGGSNGSGTVFRLAPDGSGFTLLHSFSSEATDGRDPYASLIQGPDGTLYGTTKYGGSADRGTVFRLAPDGGGFTLLRSFTDALTDGKYPTAGLIQGPDGTLYGTTSEGGSADAGTVFQMASDGGGFTLLHSFNFGDDPSAGLIQGPDGTLYGTTLGGGSSGWGAVFRLASDGSGFMLLHSFTAAPDGQSPNASLIQGPDGTLYGTTSNGGYASQGTIFQLVPDGSGSPAPAQLHRPANLRIPVKLNTESHDQERRSGHREPRSDRTGCPLIEAEPGRGYRQVEVAL